MKNLIVVAVILVGSSVAWGQSQDFGVVPSGATSLWRFQTEAEKFSATFGVDLTSSHVDNSAWFSGPWTMIGVPEHAGLYADGGVIQERSWDYLTVNPSFAVNGGGTYVNQYTVAIDYVQTSNGGLWEGDYYNSLYQTDADGNTTDGDLFLKGPSTQESSVGTAATGYSTMTFDASTWHRIVWSVDNGDDTGAGGFFRVYVDGELFLDAPGQGRDGRFSVMPDQFHLFADNSWEDAWGLVGTVATWNRALTTPEIFQMGGWVNGRETPTELMMLKPGDANKDGFVNEFDAQRLAENWGIDEYPMFGLYETWWEMGDFNMDEVIDMRDASILAANWTGSSESAAAAVPEPSTLVLLVVGALAMLTRLRRFGS